MKRLNELIADPIYNQYLTKIRQREKERIFCKHDWSHFINVGRIAYMLMLEEGLKEDLLNKLELKDENKLRETIYIAAILHDIGRWQEYETGEDHAEVSAELAKDLLVEYEFTSLEQRIISRAIREHRGEINKNKSLLGNLICQADNLSRDCHLCLARQECKSVKNPIIQY